MLPIVSEVRSVITEGGYNPDDFTIEALPSTADHPAGFSVFHSKSSYQQDYTAEEGRTAVESFRHALKRGDYPK